ncbi:hydroxymethylglutaryl-CoA reductase [Gynuella sunshinyii]|uniref:hydroxymethylglutaryl-CoA reductase (NADPH) n=1 Tax=Gynuella sunshinyii YC6258 TaxID=1445510 RepID=A0A0C5VV05_9GAMM|nr:hydroxymethylglutaryl-CoA reductase [Gynuella sunshinyii]AJQ97133.1 hydroxymethylglutaryl-CoA reductase [Gynuella sunshinyii YC6258]
MAIPYLHANSYLENLLRERDQQELSEALRPKPEQPAKPRLPRDHRINSKMLARRWELFADQNGIREQILDPATEATMDVYQHNIENFIGTVKLPVGVAGPLRVNGLFAQGDYYIPLATTEAALVASYNRGAQLISRAGGCTTLLLQEAVMRAPGFAFENLTQAGTFVAWAITQIEQFKIEASKTTRHGQLHDMQVTVEGNHVYLRFDFTTGDASGQNMVTIATQSICEYIRLNSPVEPSYFFLEANMSGDKKASAQSFVSVRGKQVTAEVTVPSDLIHGLLHTSPERMEDYWRMSALGGVLSGTIGVQGHYANGLAALYIACGQDAACVAESAVGVTRFELTDQGDLYAAVTLPNLIVGTVGGGTGLPSQNACLQLLGLAGAGHARAFAEVTAATVLAGELSIIGALCAGHFARAHQSLARG